MLLKAQYPVKKRSGEKGHFVPVGGMSLMNLLAEQ